MANEGTLSLIATPQGGNAQRHECSAVPNAHRHRQLYRSPLASLRANGFQPSFSLVFSTGAGNGPFGFGWSPSLPPDHTQDREKFPEVF